MREKRAPKHRRRAKAPRVHRCVGRCPNICRAKIMSKKPKRIIGNGLYIVSVIFTGGKSRARQLSFSNV